MTELVWDGKYKDGKKVAPVRIALPFQTIETINQSASDREKEFASMFASGKPNNDWKNRLIWGDKKYVLPSLLDEFAGKVNLIYIDPPFDTGANFSFKATIPNHPDNDDDENTEFIKQPSMLEQKAYRDTWGKGLDSYLQWFYETIVFLRELLAEDGSIYVHLDYHIAHYAKIVLDEVFGINYLINEIIWKRRGGLLNQSKQFGVSSDTIFLYSKSENYIWNTQYTKHDTDNYINERFKYTDDNGRKYRLSPIVSPSYSPTLIYDYKGYKPPKNGWSLSLETMKKFEADGKLVFPKDKNQRIQRKQYLDEWDGQGVQNVWDDIFPINPMAIERINYPTQKPESLLERIIKASSNEGDLVLDCFGGSGTTAAVAEKQNRRWVTCDLGRFSIHTIRKRLLGIPNVKPFIIQNLGKYERQQWMMNEASLNQNLQNERINRIKEEKSQNQNLQNDRINRMEEKSQNQNLQNLRINRMEEKDPKNSANSVNSVNPDSDILRNSDSDNFKKKIEIEKNYRHFILDLYNAQPINGYVWIHGVKSGRMVHVGSVDAPITHDDVKNAIKEFWQLVGKDKNIKTNGIDILGWDFAFEINETAKHVAAENKVDLKTKKIPNEVLEKKAVEQGDIKFFELAFLEVKTLIKKKTVTIELKDFIFPPDDVPEEVQQHITHWSQWIDYWSIDWNFKEDTFHNEWQSYRTKKKQDIELKATNDYEINGKYDILIKVIDILGNDTTKLITIKV
ncbi:MAG: putative methylase domain protein [Ignavibacteria bacterium]|nr:putative methylase domain protein [Ignavibacteria bacterium]